MKSKIGDARINTEGSVNLVLNIGSWPTMVEIRTKLRQWLPDMPMWKATNYYVRKAYFHNNFRWDGEYTLNLPIESLKSVKELLRLNALKHR